MQDFGSLMIDHLDLYKLTMLQWIWRRYQCVNVRFSFTNRTKHIRLAEVVPTTCVEEKLAELSALKFTSRETEWLRGVVCDGNRIFQEDFLSFLLQLQLSDYLVAIEDGQYALDFHGDWTESTLWETISLACMAELYAFHVTGQDSNRHLQEGERRFRHKADRLRAFPALRVTEFGTRRRYSAAWHAHVVGMAKDLLGDQLVGTSNLGLAMRYGLQPKGTMAHELFMVVAALAGNDDELLSSQNRVLTQWWDEYGHGLSIALPDTFGSTFSFATMNADIAHKWSGTRQDSGNPHEYAQSDLAWYRKHSVNPSQKSLVFSDGLDVERIIDLFVTYSSFIQTGFGWGTNLTNDVGIAPLSLVVKAVEANGRPTVKLSDNLAKATGPQEEVDRYRRVFGYTGTLNESCTY